MVVAEEMSPGDRRLQYCWSHGGNRSHTSAQCLTPSTGHQTSMEHYRCAKCYFPETKSTRDADTVDFFS